MSEIERRAARGLLLTSDREVLLMRMAFPWLAAPIWIAPGGGLEAGEDWQDALVRELREETGLCAASVGPMIWERTLQIEHQGDITHLHERYFLVATQPFEPLTSSLQGDERAWFQEFRWWPVSALSSCPAVDAGQILQTMLEDAQLAELVRQGVVSPPTGPRGVPASRPVAATEEVLRELRADRDSR